MEAYGMLLSNTSSGSLGTYTIDGQSNTTLMAPTSGSYPFYNNKLLRATLLVPDTPHTLEIAAAEADAFYLDYIILQTPNAFVTSTEASAANSGLDGVTGTSTVGVSATANATAHASSEAKTSSLHGGTIAAIVLVILLVLSATAVGLFFLRQKRQIRSNIGRRDVLGDEDAHPVMEQWHGVAPGVSNFDYRCSGLFRSDYFSA